MDNKEKRLRCDTAHLGHRYCKVYSRKMPITITSCRDCSFSTDIRPMWLHDKSR